MNTLRVLLLVLASACASAFAADPILIINEGNDHYFKLDSSKMTVAELNAYIDFSKNKKVTHFFKWNRGHVSTFGCAEKVGR